MASIAKRGAKHLVKWRDPDGAQHTRSCPDLKTARTLKLEVEQARALGRRWREPDAVKAPSLIRAQKAYLAYRKTRKRESTTELDGVAIRRFTVWSGRQRGQQTVSRLTVDALRDFDVSLRGELCDRTANAYVLVIRRWWAWLFGSSEFRAHLEPAPESGALDLPEVAWAPPHAPSWAEMDRAVGHATGWLHLALSFMRYTGLRQSQVMRLRWEDVDLDDSTLTIRPELGKSKQERAGRTVPISHHLVALLRNEPLTPGWIVAPRKRERRIDSRLAAECWSRSGVPTKVWKGHPDHAFRYGITTGLDQLGADRDSVERLVGHAVGGARAFYLDTRQASRLRETVDLIPAVGSLILMQRRQEA